MNIPIPPTEFRILVGTPEPESCDNPSGEPIYCQLGLPDSCYRTVFDFGCGCGRLARQLLQQSPRPQRYVGIEPNRAMVDWCAAHLTPHDANFTFLHHDVYSPGYADHNTLQLSQPFPVIERDFSLLIAHSVFTHLSLPQTEYYLGEVARILADDGVAVSTWFLFDNDSFPFLEQGPFCLYTSAAYFSQAAIYDRKWLLRTLQGRGLRVRATVLPRIPGHQWTLVLERRTGSAADAFPLGEEGADRVCGAARPRVPGGAPAPADRRDMAAAGGADPMPPQLDGPLAELRRLRQQRHERYSFRPWLRRLWRKLGG